MSKPDMENLILSSLGYLFSEYKLDSRWNYKTQYPNIWIFSDIYLSYTSNLLALSTEALQSVSNQGHLKDASQRLKRLQLLVETKRNDLRFGHNLLDHLS